MSCFWQGPKLGENKFLKHCQYLRIFLKRKKVRLKEGWYVMFLAGGAKVGESRQVHF